MTKKVLLVKIGNFLSSNQEFLLLGLLLQKNWPKNIVVYILANRPLASTWLPLIKTSISGNCSISVENLQYFHNSFPNTKHYLTYHLKIIYKFCCHFCFFDCLLVHVFLPLGIENHGWKRGKCSILRFVFDDQSPKMILDQCVVKNLRYESSTLTLIRSWVALSFKVCQWVRHR